VILEDAQVPPPDDGAPPAMEVLTLWTTQLSTTPWPPLPLGCPQRLVTAAIPPLGVPTLFWVTSHEHILRIVKLQVRGEGRR